MRRGFTLVELLAVIVILAVISVITMPVIKGVIEKVNYQSVKDSTYGILESADIYYATNNSDKYESGKIVFTCDGKSCKNENGNILNFKGEVPTSGKIIVSSDGLHEVDHITLKKYCVLGTRNKMDIKKDCDKVDITNPSLDVVQATSSSNSITIGVNTSDKETRIKKIKYEFEGKTYEEVFNDYDVSTTKTFNNLKANKEYTVKVTVINDGGLISNDTVTIKTIELGTLKISLNPSPSNPVNGYYKSEIATIDYNGSANVSYYVKSERSVTSNIDTLKSCGIGTMPGECTGAVVKKLEANTWYMFSNLPKLTYNESSTSTSNLYAYITDGKNDFTTSATIHKIDANEYKVNIGSVASTSGTIVVNYSLNEGYTGTSLSCVYGLNTNYGSNGILDTANRTCTFKGLQNGKTYYFKITPTDGFGNVGVAGAGSKATIASYANGTVIYYNPVTNQACSASQAVSTHGTKTGCMKWYAFLDSASSSTVPVILDHDTTKHVAFCPNAGCSYGSTALAQVKADTSGWNSAVKSTARLLTVNEVARISGVATRSSWTYSNHYNFSSNSSWLALNIQNAQGYWLYDPVSGNGGVDGWEINFYNGAGGLNWSTVTNAGVFGVRPVINIPKSSL